MPSNLNKISNRIAKLHRHYFFNKTATSEISTLSLHDALPISHRRNRSGRTIPEPWHRWAIVASRRGLGPRSEEHTSELQSRRDLVCRLLLEKKNGISVKMFAFVPGSIT